MVTGARFILRLQFCVAASFGAQIWHGAFSAGYWGTWDSHWQKFCPRPIVNPQSFGWTMALHPPLGRLFAPCTVVALADTATTWPAERTAAGRDTVLEAKEDW